MGTSRRTLLIMLSLILPAATLTAVSADASTRVHHAKSVHHSHRTVQVPVHKAPVAG